MSGFRDKGFGDRLSTAANARVTMLERVRAKPTTIRLWPSAERSPAVSARDGWPNARPPRSPSRPARPQSKRLKRPNMSSASLRGKRGCRESGGGQRSGCSGSPAKAVRDARYAARKARK